MLFLFMREEHFLFLQKAISVCKLRQAQGDLIPGAVSSCHNGDACSEFYRRVLEVRPHF